VVSRTAHPGWLPRPANQVDSALVIGNRGHSWIPSDGNGLP
jgi:hypothetical protein